MVVHVGALCHILTCRPRKRAVLSHTDLLTMETDSLNYAQGVGARCCTRSHADMQIEEGAFYPCTLCHPCGHFFPILCLCSSASLGRHPSRADGLHCGPILPLDLLLSLVLCLDPHTGLVLSVLSGPWAVLRMTATEDVHPVGHQNWLVLLGCDLALLFRMLQTNDLDSLLLSLCLLRPLLLPTTTPHCSQSRIPCLLQPTCLCPLCPSHACPNATMLHPLLRGTTLIFLSFFNLLANTMLTSPQDSFLPSPQAFGAPLLGYQQRTLLALSIEIALMNHNPDMDTTPH